MHIKHGQWEGKTIQVEKGKRKKKFFFQNWNKLSRQTKLYNFTYEKGNEDGKNRIIFNVESINYLLNNSMDYHTDSVFYLF